MSKHKRDDDPIGDYVEWTDHRYDPGYYLGGNTPPYLRTSRLSQKSRRLVGVWFGIFAVMALVGDIAWLFEPGELSRTSLVFSVLVTILLGWVAVAMFRSASRHETDNAGRHRHGKPHGRA
ncbi:MAG TPA: hypothetical protein VJN96_13655 [Vicinamibacterales bacterium]|nr:hypothetical protein [Vicinamibacterales bacterium]